jgi:hypothetical protein
MKKLILIILLLIPVLGFSQQDGLIRHDQLKELQPESSDSIVYFIRDGDNWRFGVWILPTIIDWEAASQGTIHASNYVDNGDTTFIDLYDTPVSYPATDLGKGLIASDTDVQFSDIFGSDATGFWAKTNGTDTIDTYINDQVIVDSTGGWTEQYTLESTTGELVYQADVLNSETYSVYCVGSSYTYDGSTSDTIRYYVDNILVMELYNGATFTPVTAYTATASETINLRIEAYNSGLSAATPGAGYILLHGAKLVDHGSIRVVDDTHATVYTMPGYLGTENQPLVSDGVNKIKYGNVLNIDSILSDLGSVYIPEIRTETIIVDGESSTDSLFYNKAEAKYISKGDTVQSGTMSLFDFWYGTQAEYTANTAKNGVYPQDTTTIWHIKD